MKSETFISYAHEDERRVDELVAVYSATGGKPFMAARHLKPGVAWAIALEGKVLGASTVCVFWSRAASRSEWVRTEYQWGLANDVHIIPVLLDNTPLPEELGRLQAIDVRPAWLVRIAWLRGKLREWATPIAGMAVAGLVVVVVWTLWPRSGPACSPSEDALEHAAAETLASLRDIAAGGGQGVEERRLDVCADLDELLVELESCARVSEPLARQRARHCGRR